MPIARGEPVFPPNYIKNHDVATKAIGAFKARRRMFATQCYVVLQTAFETLHSTFCTRLLFNILRKTTALFSNLCVTVLWATPSKWIGKDSLAITQQLECPLGNSCQKTGWDWND